MKKLITLCALALASTFTLAQVASADLSSGEVRKLDKDAKRVTIKHGPIKNLDMPGMTMVFQVRDQAVLDNLPASGEIRFRAEQLQGAYVITQVENVPQ
jgi:Cu/Ag efflux protein CusF